MNYNSTDIDIDFADSDEALKTIDHVAATMLQRNIPVRHPSGVYFQDIPIHPVTGRSSLEYTTAEKLGYFKIDFLNQSVYQTVKNEAHLDELMNREPLWELLDEETFVAQLPHIHNHFKVVSSIGPKSIEDLAIVLALIRPGKRHLLNRTRSQINREIWDSDGDGYQFKKAHAISYAVLIVVQMNIVVDQLMSDESYDYIRI